MMKPSYQKRPAHSMFIKSLTKWYSALLIPILIIGCRNEVDNVVLSSSLHIESLFAMNGNRTVTLGWTVVENGNATRLQIYRSTDKNFTPSSHTLIASLAPATIMYVDTSVSNNQRYFYRIIPVEETSGGTRRSGISDEATMARPYDYSTVDKIVFSEHIQPIFLSACAVSGCHIGESANEQSIAKRLSQIG